MITLMRQVNKNDSVLLAQVCANFTEDQAQRIREYVDRSDELWAGVWDGEVVVVWGLIPGSMLSTNAYLWCDTFPPVVKCKVSFLRASKRVIDEALTRYDSITGLCTGNLNWLRWLGAEFREDVQGYPSFIIRP